MYLVLKLECVFLMLWEFTMLHNSHKEGLTWSWEAAQFHHPVLHASLLLCWGWAISLFRRTLSSPSFLRQGLSGSTLPWDQREEFFPDLWLIQDEDLGWSGLCFQRMTPKCCRTHRKHQARQGLLKADYKRWSSLPTTEDTEANLWGSLGDREGGRSFIEREDEMNAQHLERTKLHVQETQYNPCT